MATTTLMFRGIPRTLTPGSFLQELQRHVHITSLDFVYLPWVDGKAHNVGRAFVNFTTPESAVVVWRAMNGRTLAAAPRDRPLEVLPAQAQGLGANIAQCQHRLQLAHGSEHDPFVFFNGQRANFRIVAAGLPRAGPPDLLASRAARAPQAAAGKSQSRRQPVLEGIAAERAVVEVRRMRICEVFESDAAEPLL